jgi:hypothetical protein
MGTELATIEPILPLDQARPARMPSLPGWVELRLASLARVVQVDQAGKYREAPTLPRDLLPIDSQKAMLRQHVAALNKSCSMTPEADAGAEAATLVIVTKMLLALAGQRTSETGAEAKGEAYMAALDDIPAWAVDEAVRGWYRGSSRQLDPRQPHDFRYAPAPAVLRRLAKIEAFKVKGRAIALQALIDAEPKIEYSEEHCATMRERIAGLFLGRRAAEQAKAAL